MCRVSQKIPSRYCWEKPKSDFHPYWQGLSLFQVIKERQGCQSHNGEASVYARHCYLPNIYYSHVILETAINSYSQMIVMETVKKLPKATQLGNDKVKIETTSFRL